MVALRHGTRWEEILCRRRFEGTNTISLIVAVAAKDRHP